jgi:23S rRNA (adenine2503-C2)-methyltransferase
MTIDMAKKYFASVGEKDFRATQLYSWVYDRNIRSFDEMTNFSKQLRADLSSRFELTPLELVDRKRSADNGAEKFLFRTHDGEFIESVLLKNHLTEEGRITICVSSQAGCAMGCTFCATAGIGFKRNLETGEIIDQICQIRRETGLINNNVVFMGMGEPFMNYDNVMRAAEIMNYSFGFHISVRKITISTCGILPRIEQFFRENRAYNLAISLNDTSPEKRASSMPVEKKYPIAEVAALLNSITPANHGGRVTLEYVMRRDNISQDDVKRIKKLFRFSAIKLNLIPLNATTRDSNVPSREAVEQFIQWCEIINVPINVRKSLGSDIDGACGQLSGRRYDGGNDRCVS